MVENQRGETRRNVLKKFAVGATGTAGLVGASKVGSAEYVSGYEWQDEAELILLVDPECDNSTVTDDKWFNGAYDALALFSKFLEECIGIDRVDYYFDSDWAYEYETYKTATHKYGSADVSDLPRWDSDTPQVYGWLVDDTDKLLGRALPYRQLDNNGLKGAIEGEPPVFYQNLSVPHDFIDNWFEIPERYIRPNIMHELLHCFGAEHSDGAQRSIKRNPYTGGIYDIEPSCLATGYTVDYNSVDWDGCDQDNFTQVLPTNVSAIKPQVWVTVCAQVAVGSTTLDMSVKDFGWEYDQYDSSNGLGFK